MPAPRRRPVLRGTVRIPTSKPDTQRALLMAALAEGTTRIRFPNTCTESRVLRDACQHFGARFTDDPGGGTITVEGVAGVPARPAAILRTGGSGFALRHLVAVAGLVDGPCVLAGDRRMADRPLAPLIETLIALGGWAESVTEDVALPLVVWSGALSGGPVPVPAHDTSQFVSAIMTVAPYAAAPVRIEIPGPVVGAPYIRMTARAMRRFGAEVAVARDLSSVEVGQGGYRGRDVTIGPDGTSLFYFIAAAVVADADIVVADAAPGRDEFVDHVTGLGRRLGVQITRQGPDLRIRSGPPPGGRVEVDAAAVPTLVPALAAISTNLPAGLRLRGARHLRHHKTSRLAVVMAELARLGRHLRPIYHGGELDGFETSEAGPPTAHRVDSYGDHRNFMALYLAAQTLPAPVTVIGAETLGTSFPGFLTCFDNLTVEPAQV
ncbi:MAG TPA: hypothetical protein VGS19_37520 [Streptosporangiaceae bacterium]|nr:hypothetical protein [Streptosporangiaceae bacterium]